MKYWGGVMRRRELCLTLLLLLMASSLSNTAECARYIFSLSDLSLGDVFNGVVGSVRTLADKFVAAEKWWKGLGRKLEGATFRSKRHFNQWYSWLKRATEAPFTARNPAVRCVKAAWNECLRRSKGLTFASGFWCSWIVFVECHMDQNWGAHDPLYNGGRGVPSTKLYRHPRKKHPYGI